VMFAERPAGAPQAIQVWYYPGDRIGEEFVYPKSQAVSIAKANHKSVLATDTTTNANDTEENRMSAMKGASVGRVDESGNMSKDDKKAETTTAQSSTAQSQTPSASGSATTPRSGAGSTTTAGSSPASQTAPTTASNARPTTTSGSRTAGTTGRANTAGTTASKSGSNARANTTANQDNSVGTSGSARRRSLPRTASNLVAIELLSALSLAGAFGIRRLRHAVETR